MKMRTRLPVICFLPAAFLLSVWIAGAVMGAEVYVATDGRDTNPGTIQEPLATLRKAQELVRGMPVRGKEPITVWLQPGTYYVGRSLVFGPEDSGQKTAPITYQAAKEGTVTISGGMRLECDWKPYKDGIMVCDVPAAKDGKLKFSELYVNGKRQIRARFPNGDSRVPQPQGYILTKGAKPQWQNPPQRPHTEMYYDPATFTKKNWAHPEDAVVFCFQRICFDGVPFWNGQWHVRGLDPARNAILLGEGGHQQLLFHYMQAYRPGIYPNMPFYVENVLEELDSPGEWYLDVREGKLYYMPAPGVDLKTAVVEPALVQRVVQFLGTTDKPVHHITLRGVWIAQAAPTFFEPYSPAGMGDYTIHRGGAVFLEGAEDIAVDRCSLEGNSGNGFYVNCHARRVKLTNSRVVDVGESGICFTGKDNYRPDKHAKCPRCGFDHWWGWDPLSDDDIPVDCEAVEQPRPRRGRVRQAVRRRVHRQRAAHPHRRQPHLQLSPRRDQRQQRRLRRARLREQRPARHGARDVGSRAVQFLRPRLLLVPARQSRGLRARRAEASTTATSRHDFGPFEEIAKSARETTIIRRNRFSVSRLGKKIGPGLQHPHRP